METNKSILDRLKATFLAQRAVDDLLKLSDSPDGFTRENAVHHLGMLGNPAALPRLIERANDWVPQVRRGAYEAILNLRKPGNAPAFITALPALLHLESCNRADHRGLVAQIQDFLCNDDNRHLLVTQMSAADPHVAKIVSKIVMQRKLLGPEELVARCLSHPDVVVRSMASDSLRYLDSHTFESIITKVLGDKFMPVRREAFQQLLARDRARGLSVARNFLFDRHSSIREIALAALTREGRDVAELYDDAHSTAESVKMLVCILWGWAALNRTERTDDVKRYLVSKSPTLRRCALQSLARLIPKSAGPYLAVGLQDPARSVCIEASRLIIKLAAELTVSQLISTARAARTIHTAIACCNIASMGNKWDWLQLILQLYTDESNEEIENLLRVQIRDWNQTFNRNATQPTSQQIESLVLSTRLCADRIDKHEFPLLQFTLKNYGGVV